MKASKYNRYWQQVAQNLENTRLLIRADIAIMTEGEADESFWTSVFNVALPNRKVIYYFVSQAPSSTSCKSICLKYKDYTSPHFVLCVDSDFDSILDNSFPNSPFLFHTITYSWENHYCWSKQLNSLLHGIATECQFSFDNFVLGFSHLIYPYLVKLIAAKRNEFLIC